MVGLDYNESNKLFYATFYLDKNLVKLEVIVYFIPYLNDSEDKYCLEFFYTKRGNVFKRPNMFLFAIQQYDNYSIIIIVNSYSLEVILLVL